MYRASKKELSIHYLFEEQGTYEGSEYPKLIFNGQGGDSDSFRSNVESFRTFGSSPFLKQIAGSEHSI